MKNEGTFVILSSLGKAEWKKFADATSCFFYHCIWNRAHIIQEVAMFHVV